MRTYFSTFITGLGEVVQNQLKRELRDFRASLLLDGLIVYQANAEPAQVKDLRFLNNSFLAIKDFSDAIELPFSEIRTFRVVISQENELVHIPNSKLEKLEKTVSSAYKLRPDRSNPDIEFWSLTRREGQTFFGIRITKHPDYKTVLQKGQLRPELANLMCLISEPMASDVAIDPFAGSGAIPAERGRFPNKRIIASDIAGDNKSVLKMDATNLTAISDQSADKIITDPPWGISVGLKLDLPDFYGKMLTEFYRILKPHGVAVILVGKKDIFEGVLAKFESQFILRRKFDILVSGKKAAIYLLVKQ